MGAYRMRAYTHGRLISLLLVFPWAVFASSHTAVAEQSSTSLPGEPDLQSYHEVVVPPLESSRSLRFPSVEERIKIYMGNWYVPPCPGQEQVTYRFHDTGGHSVQVTDQANISFPLEVPHVIEPDELFWFDNEVMLDCARSLDERRAQLDQGIRLRTEDRIKFRTNMRLYCEDAKEIISVIQHVFLNEKTPSFPVLMQFGDMRHAHFFRMVNIPHIKKFRSGTTTSALKRVTESECYNLKSRPVLETNHGQSQYSPIVWKLATHRHYGLLSNITDIDTPWEEKLDMAIFRGQLTGSLENYDEHASDAENCQRMKRCRLVLENVDSPYVDAKLTTTRKRLADEVHGIPIVGPRLLIKELLTYKGIIMLEGNDVASGLKWALLSESVVLMPQPKHTSWAMEELLQPWVHYVPLKEDISDVEEKMKWVIERPDESIAISKHASAWMEDMEFHRDSRREERLIKAEIIRRYQTHFREVIE